MENKKNTSRRKRVIPKPIPPEMQKKKPKPKKPTPPKPEDKKPIGSTFQWKRAGKTSLVWVLILMTAIILSGLFTNQGGKEIEIEYFQYRDFLTQKLFRGAVVMDDIFHGTLEIPQTIVKSYGVVNDVTKVYLKIPYVLPETLQEWDDYNLRYSFQEKTIDWGGYMLNFIPWLLLIGVWLFIMRRMQGGGGGMKGIFSFGKSRARIWTSDRPKVTFNDVAGCVEAKEELKEVVDFLKRPKRYQKLGAKIPKGALLVGPPGTGKTLLARAVAGEASVAFFSLSGADFVEMFVGVGASRVRDLFEQGKKNSPCIIFIDELDAVGRQRGAGLGGGHDEREQTLNQLLVEMDGFEVNQQVIILAATNRPDVLDPALLRPGRFDRQIVVDAPDLQGRLGILKVHTKNIVINKSRVNLTTLAKGTPGLVGADLANLVNEAALLAARKRKNAVDMTDFEDAKDKVMMGIQRRSMILSDEEKNLIAYHEAGHALVASMISGADPIHKVTIIPRGRALGITTQLPIDEKHGYSKTYIEGRLAILMGGRSAEVMIFNELSTGAGNDIEQATKIAHKMVCEWGMSERLGPMAFGKKNEEIFLGREIQRHADYSESTARMIDEETVRLVRNAQNRAEQILTANMEILKKMAEVLLKYETIDADDIKKIIAGKNITRPSTPARKPRRRAPRKSASDQKNTSPKSTRSAPK